MTVLEVQQWRDLNGDTSTPNDKIEWGIGFAVDMLEDYLGRTLDYGIYTERLPVNPEGGFVYPRAVPVSSTPASASYQVYDDASIYQVGADTLVGSSMLIDTWQWPRQVALAEARGTGYEANYAYATVIYAGGWTSATFPATLQWAVAQLSNAIIVRAGSAAGTQIPAGARTVRIGDIQVNFGADSVDEAMDRFVPGLSDTLRGWRLGR